MSGLSHLPLGTAAPRGEAGGLFARTFSGLKWALLCEVVEAVLALGIVMVLARLVTPAQFGQLALALVFITLADTLGRRGLGPALIQRLELTRRHLAAGFALTLAMGVVLGGAMFALAPALARLVGEPDTAALVRVLALATVLTGAGVASEHRLRRELRFRALTGATLVAKGLGYAPVVIALALAGYGAWALVWGLVARQALFTGAVIVCAPPPRRLGTGAREVADLVRTGAGFSGIALLGVVSGQIVNLLVAHTLGAAALGLYTRARALSVLPARLGPVLRDVLLPAMARRQSRADRMRTAHLNAIELLSLIALPASALLAVSAPEIVAVVLGAQWEGAVAALRILAFVGAVQVMNAVHVSVIRAFGAVWHETWRRVLCVTLTVAGVWFASRFGLEGVVGAVSAAALVQHVLVVQLALRLLGVRWPTLLARHVPGLWTALGAAAALWPVAALVRAAGWSAPASLALELAAWGAAGAAAVYFAPSFARPRFAHWGLERLAFERMGAAGRLAGLAIAHLSRRWPAPSPASAQ